MKTIFSACRLRNGAALTAIALLGAGFATSAYAQDAAVAPTPVPNTVQTDTTATDESDTIVVTGSLFRRPTDVATPSPVTVVTAESLDQRGITTVQEGIQTLSFNNGPALTNSFSSNGAFGAGASAVSLRGLSTSSTLVLFDGLRAAYYPLSDDGARNFVDLNTIPDDIIDRIEVLRDGASASYGADAIAGVVNIITKREFKGISGRVEAGISERGDSANQRLSLTAGIGDLSDQGFNAYVSGFYYNTEALYNRDRPYPYNSDDLRNVCFEGTCGPNNVINGLNAANAYPGSFGGGTTVNASTLYVQPYSSTNTTALGRYQLLNPAAGCTRGTSYNLTAAELARAGNSAAPNTVCQEDISNLYGVITPEIERFGGSARFTAKVGDASEAYLQVNFLQTRVGYAGLPATIRANAGAGILFPRYTNLDTNNPATVLTLPVYVCPRTVTAACSAANGTLNPNNPFAAQGQVARLIGRLPDIQEYNETRNRVYRFAGGISGTVFNDWDYGVNITGMHTDLRRLSRGYIYIQSLLDVIRDGSYSFVDPALNDQADRDFLSPDNITDSSSDLYQAEATVGKALFELPGGPLQLGLGTAIRYEAIDAPSANDDYRGPTQRYFRLNAFGTKGNRTVYSGFAELNAPIIDQIEVNVAGRYDKYSSGQDAFSPKAGIKFTPIREAVIRGTYSRGFRIPSFAEANALPTTGFVTVSTASLPASFLSQYGAGCAASTPTGCPTYITAYPLGQTTLGTPDLEPEKSRSFTGGVLLNPIPSVTLSVDYFNIKKTNAITGAPNSAAIAAYYAGQPIPEGFAVIPDVRDPNFPNALPRIAFVQAGFINSNSIKSEGIDFAANATFDIGENARFTSALEGSYIIELSTTFADGSKQSYAGTLGNFALTAGSGTPRWKGRWQNTVEFDSFSLSGIANYYGGYDLSAEDETGPGTAGDCGLSEGFTPCKVKRYITVDAVGTFKVNDQFDFYVNVLNILDDLPPIDPVTYGANNYNAVQGGTGIFGRSFRAGVKFSY